VHEQRQPVRGRKRRQRPRDLTLLAPLNRLRRDVRIIGRACRERRHRRPARPAHAEIGRDRSQPRRERSGLSQFPDALQRPNQGFLGEIVRIIEIARPVKRERHQRGAVAAGQFRERAGVARPRALGQRRIVLYRLRAAHRL
jgi:hypothetical protein